MNALPGFSATSNAALVGPSKLTLQQFYDMPVSDMQLRRRNVIYEIEAKINEIASHFDKLAFEPLHTFSDGIYMREIKVPAGLIFVGERHAKEHMLFVKGGFCTCVTERGYEDFFSGDSFKSPAGEKRLFFTHEETTLLTVHRTDAKTLEEVKKDLILDEHFILTHK